MKSLTKLSLLNIALLTCMTCYSGSNDTPPYTPMPTADQVTLNVTHIAQNVGPNHSVHCPIAATSPTSWGGQSPIKNATINGNDTFYPFGPTANSNGYVVYTCSETYWSADPYYKQLAAETNSNPTIPCQSKSYDPEVCTVLGRDNNNLSGVLPIHFIIRSPGQTVVRNDYYSSYNRVGYMAPASMPYVENPGGGLAVPGGGWAQEFSGLYRTGSSISINIGWQATYSQSDGGGNGYTIGGADNNNVWAKCPDYNPFPRTGYFNFSITNDMLGKTCVLSCDIRTWKRYGPSGEPTVQSQTANTTLYMTAPLLMQCY